MAVDQALSLVQRHHMSQTSTQKWLDSAGVLLQSASLGVELENQTESVCELDEISAQEQTFAAGLEELRTLDPLLEHLVEPGVMMKLRENVEAMQLRSADIKQQLEAHRQILQRCVLVCMFS